MASGPMIESNAAQKATDRIRLESKQARAKFIIDVFLKCFGDGIRQNPRAFHGRFRKMAANAFNFYRGSASLFYHDLKVDQDPWVHDNVARNVFIHGDLHAKNFGSYLDINGFLNFDVNDFDEGYCGPFTWDVKRLLASLNLITFNKGFSDDEIQLILRTCAEAYLQQIYFFAENPEASFALTLENTTGLVKKLLNETRIKSHVSHLDSATDIKDYDRRFIRSSVVKDVDEATRADLVQAFEEYVKTIPAAKIATQGGVRSYKVKDIVARSSPGIGSAGKISYNFLLEGPTQTLENDIMIFMKPAQRSAISYVISNPELDQFFQHDGLRTVLCSYAMQATTPPYLGYTTFRGVSMLVDEFTAHSEDLEWDEANELSDVLELVKYLGQATAKIHCVADSNCINTPGNITALPFSIIPQHVELAIRDAIYGREAEFLDDMVQFGMDYGSIVRRDHALFFDTFRNKLIPGLS